MYKVQKKLEISTDILFGIYLSTLLYAILYIIIPNFGKFRSRQSKICIDPR